MTATDGDRGDDTARCTHWDCDQPATVGFCGFYGTARPASALIRLLTPTERRGQHVCLDHAHHLLDRVLMAQTTEWGARS